MAAFIVRFLIPHSNQSQEYQILSKVQRHKPNQINKTARPTYNIVVLHQLLRLCIVPHRLWERDFDRECERERD